VRKTSTYARKRAHSNHHGYSYSDTLGSMRLLRELERFTPAQLNSLTLPPRMAYHAISTGQARPGDFDTLAEVVNVTLIRAERIELVGYGRPDATPEELAEERATGAKAVALCCEAQDALMHMRQRFERCGRWGVDAQARGCIPAALDLHEQILTGSTRRQMKLALLEVLKRCRHGQVCRIEPVDAASAAGGAA
jgi:hypothetical protein